MLPDHQQYLEAPYRRAFEGRPVASGCIEIERPVPDFDGDGWVGVRCDVSVNDGAVDWSEYPLTDAEQCEAVERAETEWCADEGGDDFNKEEY